MRTFKTRDLWIIWLFIFITYHVNGQSTVEQRKEALANKVKQRLETGEVEPYKVNDPGNALCNCNTGPYVYTLDDYSSISDNKSVINVIDPLEGKNYICADLGEGNALISWRRWYCLGEDDNCFLSRWENGQPTFEEYNLTGTISVYFDNFGYTISKANIYYIYKDHKQVESDDYHNTMIIENVITYQESEELRLVEHIAVALKYGQKELVRELINNGGKGINAFDKYGWSALMYASRIGLEGVVEELIAGGADVLRDSEALIWASKYDFISIVHDLLEGGADVNVKDYNGFTPYYWATHENNIHLSSVLLSNGAQSTNGETALMVEVKDWTFVRTIQGHINNGIDVNARDNNGQTALIIAASNNVWDNVITLIDNGADVNAQDNNGYTAIMHCMKPKRMDIIYKTKLIDAVKYLIDSGADVNIVANDNKTAIELAKENHRDKSVIRQLKRLE